MLADFNLANFHLDLARGLHESLNIALKFVLHALLQAGWRVLQDGTKNMLPAGETMQLEDVQNMAELCPDVVTLRDPQM